MIGMGGTTEWTPRAQWRDLPGHVQDAISELLGSPVVTAVNQHGGFSPGLAARVWCADGTRAFVKAGSSSARSTT